MTTPKIPVDQKLFEIGNSVLYVNTKSHKGNPPQNRIEHLSDKLGQLTVLLLLLLLLSLLLLNPVVSEIFSYNNRQQPTVLY